MNNFKFDVPKISIGTKLRVALLVLALANIILVVFYTGEVSTAYKVFSTLFIALTACYGTWKDNPITIGARVIAAVKDDIKIEFIDTADDEFEVETVKFDKALYEKNMAENGELFKDKITDGIGEEVK